MGANFSYHSNKIMSISFAPVLVQRSYGMNLDYEKCVGNNIRKYRESKNLTQEQLSAKLQTLGCDITRSALAKMEVGQRHIYIDEIKLIKEILDVSFDELIS